MFVSWVMRKWWSARTAFLLVVGIKLRTGKFM